MPAPDAALPVSVPVASAGRVPGACWRAQRCPDERTRVEAQLRSVRQAGKAPLLKDNDAALSPQPVRKSPQNGRLWPVGANVTKRQNASSAACSVDHRRRPNTPSTFRFNV